MKKELYQFRPLVLTLESPWGKGKAALPPHATKDKMYNPNEDHPLNFLMSVAYLRGTAATDIIPQWIFGFIIVAGLCYANEVSPVGGGEMREERSQATIG